MTPAEVALAYDGMLERIEFEGNAMLMAVRQQNVKKAKPIKLRNIEQQNGKSNTSVKQSTLDKRKETFEHLGII